MPNGKDHNRSRSPNRAGMVCICVPQEQVHTECSCNQPHRENQDQEKRTPSASSTRMDISSDFNESVYGSVMDISILEVEDDLQNASKLGMMYRVESFR